VLSVSPGFATEKMLTFELSLPSPKYDRIKAQQFFEQVQQRLAALPGVQSIGATSALPLSQANNMRFFTVEGRAGNTPRDYTIEHHRFVTPQYFEALGIPLLQGRSFNAADFHANTAPAVLIRGWDLSAAGSPTPAESSFGSGRSSRSA
jgi:putative ABC transport system permease protein